MSSLNCYYSGQILTFRHQFHRIVRNRFCPIQKQRRRSAVFATKIVQSICFINSECQASGLLLWLNRPFLSDLVRNLEESFPYLVAQLIDFLPYSVLIGKTYQFKITKNKKSTCMYIIQCHLPCLSAV